MKNLISILFSLSLIIFINTYGYAQQSRISKIVNHLSEYIASETFISIKVEYGDLAASDSIFVQAINYCKGNTGDALLGLMLATVPYREVPIKLPLINTIVFYPLTSAEEEIFNQKNVNLPKYLFLDTPDNDYGDKDKLAHFFGSAYLSYESHLFDLGKLIGYFIEVFEESFKVQSSADLRDLDVNDYGRLFGEMLKSDKKILPSQIFLFRSLRQFRIIL